MEAEGSFGFLANNGSQYGAKMEPFDGADVDLGFCIGTQTEASMFCGQSEIGADVEGHPSGGIHAAQEGDVMEDVFLFKFGGVGKATSPGMGEPVGEVCFCAGNALLMAKVIDVDRRGDQLIDPGFFFFWMMILFVLGVC